MVKTNMLPEKNCKGFSLIELMIAIVILGILLAIAVPNYFKYVREARRAEAQSQMLEIRLGMERWRANNSTYSGTVSDSGFTGSNDYYTYTITGTTGSAYTINATAVSGKSQVNDVTGSGVSCTTLTLDQSGTKGSIGWDTSTNGPSPCWKK